MNLRASTFAVLVASFIQICASARIVVLYAVSTKSHMYAVMPAIEELAQRGHQVSIFSPFKGIAKNVKNGREFFLKEAAQLVDDTPVDWFAMQKEGFNQVFTMMYYVKHLSLTSCDDILTHPEFVEIMRKRDVDLFIVDGYFHEFLFPVFNRIGVPFVTHSSNSASPSMLKAMGASNDYAFVSTSTVQLNDPITFPRRLLNVLTNEILKQIRKHYIFKDLDALLQSHLPGVRSIAEVEGEASISIVNSHPMTSWPRSLPPTIVPIGALHTRPAKSLPKELKEFADGAKDGLIVFTLGSFVPVSSMPKETLDTFIRVFSKLPQRVIWKWEETVPENISSNVMTVDWLPQQDLLGHPNTQVFISHGGMLGTQEAAYHGVPLLGLPFGNDQRANVYKVERGGWGLQLDWDKIEDRILTEALTHLIHDPNFRANASRVSALMRDQLMRGTDIAVYWIEYVIRHGDTKHLKLSSRNMPFYERHLLDVTFFLVSILVIFLVIAYKSTRLLLHWSDKNAITRLLHYCNPDDDELVQTSTPGWGVI